MKSQSHIGFWLLAFAVSLFASPLFISADAMYERLLNEFLAVRGIFGDRIGRWLIEATNSVHSLFVSSGVEDFFAAPVHGERDLQDAERYFSGLGKMLAATGSRYLVALLMQFYGAIMRGFVVLAWVLLLLPFLAAAIYDGINQRHVKFATLGYQNPTAFALGAHAVILIAALPVMYVVVPFSISPLFMPAWALLTAIPLCFAISHMQPVLTR